MASTIVVTHICSALDDVQSLLKTCPPGHENRMLKILRFNLKNMKTFVLSAKKLGKDEGLESFLRRMRNKVGGNSRMVHRLVKDIESMEEEIDEWYEAMFEYMRQSASLTTHQVLEIMSSILENLVDIYDFRWADVEFEILGRGLEDLREQLTFLKSLTCFVTQASVETRQDLMEHIEAVAISAAYLLFTCKVDKFDEDKRKGMQFKISSLLQKIKLKAEIYAQVLRSSKRSRQSPVPVPTQGKAIDVEDSGMKTFLDSLVSNLWGMLRLNRCSEVSAKRQLQELYKGLRSLRSILRLKPGAKDIDIDRNRKVEEEIGEVVCDAGVIICSLCQTPAQVDDDLGIQNLLETIKIVVAKVRQEEPEPDPISLVPKFKSWSKNDRQPQVPAIFKFWSIDDQLGFADILLRKLMEMELVISQEGEPNTRSRLQTIQEEVAVLRCMLGEMENEIETVELQEQEQVRNLWDCVSEVTYRIECLIDHLDVDVGGLPFPDSLLGSIEKDMANIKAKVLKIFEDQRQRRDIKVINEVTTTCCETISTNDHPIYLGDEIRSLKKRLRGESKPLRIIAITGMHGVGKTTLAAKAYNDPKIRGHFGICAWATISRQMNKKKVLLHLLNQIDPHPHNRECDLKNITEEDLGRRLHRILKRKRYLIVLDDIWDTKAWFELQTFFPDDGTGSRLLFTSRNRHVAPNHMLDNEPLSPSLFTRRDGAALFEELVYPTSAAPPAPELRQLWRQIVDKCGGLPLAITVAARLFAVKLEYEDIFYGGLSSIVESIAALWTNTSDLGSYKPLPDHLKACFLYFATFPKDEEIPVRRLLRLWIAEGFVQKDPVKSPEDVAESYLQDLVDRSLIMVAKQKSDGEGVKTCRLHHDLLHDFCVHIAKEGEFLHFVKGYDELSAFNDHPNLRRLCIESKPEHFKESKLFCPRARSLRFNCSKETDQGGEELLVDVSSLIHCFKLVTVLDLEHINLGCVFPSEIQGLVQLVFLAIRGTMSSLPSSIAKLSNLETLIVDPGTKMISLPDNLRDLQKLQYLYIRSSPSHGGATVPTKHADAAAAVDNSSSSGLITFSGAVVPSWGNLERVMRKFPHIRRLKCKQDKDHDPENVDRIVVDLDFLTQLESLHLSSFDGFLFECGFPANLRKLTLSGFHLQSWKISAIGKMPNLQVLKLLDVSFARETWEIKEGEFLRLRFLKLCSASLVRWRAIASTGSDDEDEDEDYRKYKLEKLVLDGCRRLEEIPSSLLETIPTLQMIEARDCPMDVVEHLKLVQEKQMETANIHLKIHIQSSRPSGSEGDSQSG